MNVPKFADYQLHLSIMDKTLSKDIKLIVYVGIFLTPDFFNDILKFVKLHFLTH